jgi:hypothetical protein
MLVQPQQAATVCELDLVQHASGHGNGLRPWIRNNDRRTAHEPLNLTLDLEHAHVSGHSRHRNRTEVRDPNGDFAAYANSIDKGDENGKGTPLWRQKQRVERAARRGNPTNWAINGFAP